MHLSNSSCDSVRKSESPEGQRTRNHAKIASGTMHLEEQRIGKSERADGEEKRANDSQYPHFNALAHSSPIDTRRSRVNRRGRRQSIEFGTPILSA
jgi:hypothetical protein